MEKNMTVFIDNLMLELILIAICNVTKLWKKIFFTKCSLLEIGGSECNSIRDDNFSTIVLSSVPFSIKNYFSTPLNC